MKILHVGDIHLGCALENQKRNREIENVFNHLADYVRENDVKAALLAGDVFDKGSPSNESQELYYRFLLNLQKSGCRQVIVIAGNHDSSSFLDAPQALLKEMNIHIIGNVSAEDQEKEVIALGDEDAPEAYVCAVPYLNERDVRSLSPEGESAAERESAVARGIEKHYRDVFQIADRKRNGKNIPVIGMGHLYAVGSTFATSDDPRTPVGNLNAVDLTACAEGYAYMALGHLHKAQTVKDHENWRYAGSILPMNLRENGFAPQVVVLDTADLAHPIIHELPAACFHEMKVIRGNLEELRAKLSELDATGREIWLKVVYTGEEILPNWSIELRQEFRDRKIQLLVTEVQRKNSGSSPNSKTPETEKTIAKMTPEDVFLDYLDQKGEVTDPAQRETYLALFRRSMYKVCDPAEQKEAKTPPVHRGVMKFEQLYIKNVNSLYGENRINFTVPEFKEGIFLISGNTGSGKSSILDAICLALFGTTPRAASGAKRGAFSQQKDCVMSEGTNEVQAELTFSLAGTRYRACFYHRRTVRGKEPFAAVQHQLYQNDRQIPGTPGEIKAKIIELIGMDQVQFCRCVLLAQGSFDAFLKAEASERSAILKNITGTEIYSEIGKRINLDFADVKANYEREKQALEGISLLTDEEERGLQEKRAAAVQKIKISADDLKKRESIEAVFQAIVQANADLQKAEEQVADAEKARLRATPRRQELEAANRALNCEDSYRKLQNLKARQKELQTHMAELKKQQPQLEKHADELKKKHAALEQELNALKKRQKKDQKLFQEVRLLDNQISDFKNQCTVAQKEFAEAQSQLYQCDRTFQNAQAKWNNADQNAAEARSYCRSHAADEKLSQLKITWNLRKNSLADEEQRNAGDKRALETCQLRLKRTKQELEQGKQELLSLEEAKKSLSGSLEKHKQKMAELLLGKTYHELHESWAAAMNLNTLFKNPVQRKEYLPSGEPCPLCGAKRHPYCEGTPAPDGKEYEKLANKLNKKIQDVDACQVNIREIELKQEQCETGIKAQKKRIAELKKTISADEKAEKEQARLLAERVHGTAEKVAALTAEMQKALKVQSTDRSAMLKELDKRIETYDRMHRILDSLEADKAEYDKAFSAHAAMKPQLEKLRSQKEKQWSDLLTELKTRKEKRRDKFGEKNVEDEETKLVDTVECCQQNLKDAVEKTTSSGEQVKHNLKEQRENQSQQESLTAELKQAETQFSAKLRENDFFSEEEFYAKKRNTQYIQQLTIDIQAIDNCRNTAQGIRAERQRILDDTQKKLPEGAERQGNLEQISQLQQQCEELQKELNATEVELAQAKKARQQYEECGKRIAALNVDFNHWKYLDDNFGTASADRFGRIAQGYTFRELLCFANHNRLRSLQKHFTLINDKDDPLELNVVDHYRGDQVRTSRNLSGGESFEVSLALALGLAEMSAISQHASLGNVLLDEGFGTLDDDALESALELLMQLKQTDQKLVGIISHVSKLKDRINTRIEVTSTGGMGSLSGAGVSKMGSSTAIATSKKPGRKKAKKLDL